MTQSLLRQSYRFVVTMEDDDSGKIITFAVIATSASVATARTIMAIENDELHTGDGGYSLIPRLSKEKADYEII